MADPIPPRRGEPIVDENGIPSLRLMEFLESLAGLSSKIDGVESQIGTMAASTASIDGLRKDIEELRVQVACL